MNCYYLDLLAVLFLYIKKYRQGYTKTVLLMPLLHEGMPL